MKYEERFYRNWTSDNGLVSFNVSIKETDLKISADKDLSAIAQRSIKKYRTEIESYIERSPAFGDSLIPIKEKKTTTDIIHEMLNKSEKATVGPMATVAGAISEFVGKDLLKSSNEVIVENGGDIFISTKKKRIIGIYAGKDSIFSNKIGIEINSDQTPIGLCTSSGTVGHSLSFGNSDAVIVKSRSTLLADGVATLLGNCLKKTDQIESVLKKGMLIDGVMGIILIIKEKIGVLGDIKLVRI